MGTSTRSAPGRNGSALRPRIERGLGVPLFVLNLKTYPAVLGASAVRIARALASAGNAARVPVAIAPALPDLGRVAHEVAIPVLAQHVDPLVGGARTGSVPVEAIAAAGACGSLVNHSERPLSALEVGRAVSALRGAGLMSVVCAPDHRSAARFARYRPDYLAVEPPELIGGDRSVSTTRPELVATTVRRVHAVAGGVHVLCGAGIRSREDVRRALELGTEGILVASAVTRAADPRRAIKELLAGF